MSTSPPTVIVYRSELLGRSETFIKEQIRTLKAWHPMLVGERLVHEGLPLDGLNVQLLPPLATRWQRALYKACRRLWLPYPPHLTSLRAVGAKVIHAHFGTSAVEVYPYARALGLPLLVTLHGYDIAVKREWWESGRGGSLRRVYPKRLLCLGADSRVHFLAVSNAIRLRAIDYGIPAERVTVSYIGVDIERFQPRGLPLHERRKRILFVGRMVEKKAPLLLVQAFAHLRRRLHEAELVMVGDGPLRTDAERLADTLGVPITFTGSISSDQVLTQLHEARVFCLPSVTATNGDAEGLPISILEAQGCGVPVVTTTHSGNPEGISPGESGFAVAEADADALAHALTRLLVDDVPLLTRMSASARELAVSRFGLSRCATALEQAYSWPQGD